MPLRSLVFLLILFLASISAGAQSTISKEKRQLIGEIISIMKMDTLMQQMTEETLKGMESTFPTGYNYAIVSNPKLTKTQKDDLKKGQSLAFGRISVKFRDRMRTEIDFKEYIDEAIYPLYDKFYSEEELRDIVQFYKTPTGRKVIDTMPQVYAESRELAERILLPKVLPIVTEIVEEEFKSLDQPPPSRRKVQ